jgi:predicted secreted protein
MSNIVLRREDSGKPIDAQVGDVITIQLTDISTTGYRWTVDPLEGSVLTPLDSRVEPGGPALGASGSRSMDFRVAAGGSARLVLKLLRPWIGESSVRDRFEITVNASAPER